MNRKKIKIDKIIRISGEEKCFEFKFYPPIQLTENGDGFSCTHEITYKDDGSLEDANIRDLKLIKNYRIKIINLIKGIFKNDNKRKI